MKRVLLLVLLIFVLMPAQAQDETHPLLEMLAHLPQSLDESLHLLNYADVELSLSAWHDAPQVNSIEDYEALSETERSDYYDSLPSIMPSSMSFVANRGLFAEFYDGMAIDFFSIDQVLHFFEIPPEASYQAFRGDFDEDLIISKRLEQGYSQEGEEWIVLCPTESCAGEGSDAEDSFQNPRYILGNNQLLSTNQEALALTLATINGDEPSRLDIPDYAASARLLLDAGSVSQAVFVDHAYLAPFNQGNRNSGLASLPAYGLMSVAELVFPEDEIVEVHIVLSYENAEDAEVAVAILEESFSNPEVFNPDYWEFSGGSLERIEILEDVESGLFLVRAVLSSPMPSHEDSLSWTLYRLIYRISFGILDFNWVYGED